MKIEALAGTGMRELERTAEAALAIGKLEQLAPDLAATVWQDFRRRNLPEPPIEHVVDGLTKARLDIDPPDTLANRPDTSPLAVG